MFPLHARLVAARARSWLFTPGTRPDRFANASKHGADVLIVDLEDAVPPNEKRLARDNARVLFGRARDAAPLVAVRINSIASRHGLDDLALVADAVQPPDFVLLPKIESPDPVAQAAALLGAAGRAAALIPMIESARGMFAAAAIAGAGPCVWGLMFGAADYASDVGAQPGARALELARCTVAAAAASAGVRAIDAPCFALHEPDALRAELDFAVDNGLHAKAAIHPAHAGAINAAFTPSPARIAWARDVLAASERGAGVVAGRMVDEAIAREARRVLAGV
ncbi:aldolase/citrate lyase family protein [Burkholderia alba]|uniref:aldolase/citrate lyase family protein n=1 Tax=Burkholderia alba TaxID=2683677 RepID=UPI002B052C9E|nr:aldolase/citrate lyase family protein [Burkholderia alba]